MRQSNLAGQPVGDKKSGLFSPSSPRPVVVNGSSRAAGRTAKKRHAAQPSSTNAAQQVGSLNSNKDAAVTNIPQSVAYPIAAQAVPVIASQYPPTTVSYTGGFIGRLFSKSESKPLQPQAPPFTATGTGSHHTVQADASGPVHLNNPKPTASAEAGGRGPSSDVPAGKTESVTYRTPKKTSANASRHPIHVSNNQYDNQSSESNSPGEAGHKDFKEISPLKVPRQRASSSSGRVKTSAAIVSEKTQEQATAGKIVAESTASPQKSGMPKFPHYTPHPKHFFSHSNPRRSN